MSSEIFLVQLSIMSTQYIARIKHPFLFFCNSVTVNLAHILPENPAGT